MRISEQKTTAAKFRAILEMKIDEDFLALVGCSPDLWKKTENGNRNLTPARAALIESMTGCSQSWLLENNVKKPAIDHAGQPFTKQSFDQFRAAMMRGKIAPLGVAVNPFGAVVELAGIADAAAENHRLAEFAVCLKDCIASLQKRFGINKETAQAALDFMAAIPQAHVMEICEPQIRKGSKDRVALAVEILSKDKVLPFILREKQTISDLPAKKSKK